MLNATLKMPNISHSNVEQVSLPAMPAVQARLCIFENAFAEICYRKSFGTLKST